ncbi:hypothetical protein Q0Z83_012190 [Actinoplanes sichuanensis]|uniref:AbfB domain-containing protein n=1 Tax=Actinoplanes sichuanensis TaxID=512349 RepID=A0ABW4A4Z9_9ACTN|nr:AbfB domain-containing protein [Actinoplanes sichuanensis]BEL03028.1 hypothetical protein Q0Z83_012190 [Actinoplanes sichuanensis]
MTKADNSETLRIGGWIPPYATGGTEPATTPAGPDGRHVAGLPTQPVPIVQPLPARSRRPLLVLAGATALAVLGYGIAAVVVSGDEPPRAPEFALPAPPLASPAVATPPVSLLPSPPEGEVLPTRDIRNVRVETSTRPTPTSAVPSRAPATTAPTPDPAFTVGRTVGVGVTGLDGQRLRNRDFVARIEADSAAKGLSGRFVVRQGLADAGCLSFESAEHPGFHLRHRNYVLLVERAEPTALYLSDATFCPVSSGGGFALRSVNYPDHHLIVAAGQVRLVRSTAAQATPFRALAPI